MRIVILSVVVSLVVISLVSVLLLSTLYTEDTPSVVTDIIQEPDIVMPTKSSRPGCEEDNACYIPDALSIPLGYTITWENQDAAFHSVTSGVYGNATDLFDSGHMEYGQTFTYTFEHVGSFLYHCTLHPWMNGTILVTEER